MTKSIASEYRDNLGNWITHRFSKTIEAQERSTENKLFEIQILEDKLSAQWALQKRTQMSAPPIASSKLMKELDRVLSLQAQVDVVDNELQMMHTAMKETKSESQATLGILEKMEGSQTHLRNKVELLYMTLNVPKEHSHLWDVDTEYLKVLFLARELKIGIRKCAIGSFFEWDRLDQAVGGKVNPLGTSTPAIHSSRFNICCRD
ncbi:hypothetical protein SCLCIDRAFT_133891 [Scleroderma citrinum Foug A]|uniref:Uncharacterized protein n=1 Tax=Scleroderma citrinum Foug A TaxID=1036808 RepID=A0A0C3D4S2_9AGAM|nr:hypothetical protein SCLCIDRAFT_133891 [Scleroderma citrinum Foug A]